MGTRNDRFDGRCKKDLAGGMGFTALLNACRERELRMRAVPSPVIVALLAPLETLSPPTSWSRGTKVLKRPEPGNKRHDPNKAQAQREFKINFHSTVLSYSEIHHLWNLLGAHFLVENLAG